MAGSREAPAYVQQLGQASLILAAPRPRSRLSIELDSSL